MYSCIERLHGINIRTAETKAFRTFIRVTPQIKLSDCVLSMYKALTRHLLTHASPAWEFVSGTHALNPQGLEDKVLLKTDKFPRRTQIRELRVASRIPCFNNFIKKIAQAANISRTKPGEWKYSQHAKPSIENKWGLKSAVVKHAILQAKGAFMTKITYVKEWQRLRWSSG